MATFGIEAIRYFSHFRASGVMASEHTSDLTYTFNRANGFRDKLQEAGHLERFYWANTDVWETDLRDVNHGGDDVEWVDNVDLFWIETHGGQDPNGQPELVYDTPQTAWRMSAPSWELGEDWNSEWIMVFGCNTVPLWKPWVLQGIFAGLHIYCGAWDLMWDGWTTDECGGDVAANLTDGDTVSDAWIDGVSDWYFDNHPITVCVGDEATWNGGSIRWNQSYLNRDHLWGHGEVLPDLPPERQACVLWRWAEG
jgi:hypothetical protein